MLGDTTTLADPAVVDEIRRLASAVPKMAEGPPERPSCGRPSGGFPPYDDYAR